MNYEMIKRNFERGLWNEQMVAVAVRKGVISAEQYHCLLYTSRCV